ncbi:MAG: hypothetical protein JRJ23_11060 [Deltaproteobacteria bacterium]|nr:hypothetical protein [Deltaproteobacteria bacterium]
MYANEKDHHNISRLLETWSEDPQSIKDIFIRLRDRLIEKECVILSFKSRPGVSHSLRSMIDRAGQDNARLFNLLDIIDDDPGNRWLSICFYSATVTDPEEMGDLIPEGILGEDGYCFDLFEYDKDVISYIEQRIDEAYDFVLQAASKPTP